MSANSTLSGNKIFLAVQRVTLPKYGFQGDQPGVVHMMKALGPFNSNEEIGRQGLMLNGLLSGNVD